MSTTLYLALERKIPQVNPNESDRVLLAELIAEEKRLAHVAGKLKVRSLGDFLSYDPKLLAGYIDDPDELKAAMGAAKPLEWFDPAEAIKSVRAFAKHFESRPTDLPAEVREYADELLEELNDVEAILEKAIEKGVRFRSWIGA